MGEIHSSHTPPRLPQQPQQKLLPMQPIPQQQALPRTGKTLEEILLWETLTQGKYLIECFFWLHLVQDTHHPSNYGYKTKNPPALFIY